MVKDHICECGEKERLAVIDMRTQIMCSDIRELKELFYKKVDRQEKEIADIKKEIAIHGTKFTFIAGIVSTLVSVGIMLLKKWSI